MCKENKACTKCQNKSNRMAGKAKKRKATPKTRVTRRRRSRVSGLGSDFNIEELALIAAGALGAKMLINPLGKAIFPKNDPPKYYPLLAKAALALGLTKVGMPQAKSLAKGVALSALLEAAETFMPKIFAPKLKAAVEGYDELAGGVELSLEDINGYGDESLAGYGDEESMAGYGEESLAGYGSAI
jgi:hypothetical protein